MDIIVYNEASTANERIEKFIENPDSNSGIITVPKVIETGESVTVPAGRVAVLPNVQVDGTLNIKGEVFIPSGSSVDFSNGIKVNGERLTMSIPTAYHIYNGSVEATNTILTNGFSTTLYTGNGTTQDVVTGVDMATQWGDDASETYGGLVWLKSRSGTTANILIDTVRGIGKQLYTDNTVQEQLISNILTSFNTNGFSIGNEGGSNTNLATYASWNFQTTHRISGVTNHGKPYTCHYNPYTGFTIVKYEGSGLAGHEIPHHLGRKLGFTTVKNLTSVAHFICDNSQFGRNGDYLHLNLTNAVANDISHFSNSDEDSITVGTTVYTNTSANQYVLYGWANSYFDESNKLIGNYEIGVYQGTGVVGNKVTTRGKPAWVMIKRLDSTGNWWVLDNQRGNGTYVLYPNLSNIESASTLGTTISFNIDGFTCISTDSSFNASGGQYLYMVVYDNDSGSGKSKYPKSTDTTNLNINALVPYANGIDVNGSKVSIEYKNETITGLTLTQGKNYVYSKNDGTYGVSKYEPMYGSLRNRSVAGENHDYFDLKTMKWYKTIGGNELVTNGTFSDGTTTGWTADTSGGAGTTFSTTNGVLQIFRGASTPFWGSGEPYQILSLVVGSKYTIKCNLSGNSCTVTLSSKLGIPDIHLSPSSIGTFEYTFVAPISNMYLKFYPDLYSGTTNIDNISVFEVEPTIGAEITPRTYLDCIVHADKNWQVSYVEELPKTTYFNRIETSDNRVVMYLEDYGISQIQNNKRYVLNNPFGNENCMDCDVKIELMINNKWFGAGWDGNAGSGASAYGTTVFSQSEGITIQTGANAVNGKANVVGSGYATADIITAPARVIVTYKGKTRRVKNG